MFVPLNYDKEPIEVPATASEVFVKGAALVYASGLVTAAASSTATDIWLVTAEAKTIGSGGGNIKCYPTVGVLYEADCDAAWATVNIGTLADLASVTTINPDASDNDLFYIASGVGVTAVGTKVRGFFQHVNET